jgi:hypothetical protein
LVTSSLGQQRRSNSGAERTKRFTTAKPVNASSRIAMRSRATSKLTRWVMAEKPAGNLRKHQSESPRSDAGNASRLTPLLQRPEGFAGQRHRGSRPSHRECPWLSSLPVCAQEIRRNDSRLAPLLRGSKSLESISARPTRSVPPPAPRATRTCCAARALPPIPVDRATRHRPRGSRRSSATPSPARR